MQAIHEVWVSNCTKVLLKKQSKVVEESSKCSQAIKSIPDNLLHRHRYPDFVPTPFDLGDEQFQIITIIKRNLFLKLMNQIQMLLYLVLSLLSIKVIQNLDTEFLNIDQEREKQ